MTEQGDIIQTVKIPKGSLICVTSGDYSDYQLEFVAKAKRSFTMAGAEKEWAQQHPDFSWYRPAEFLKWLVVESGLLKEIPHVEWHIEDYGEPYVPKPSYEFKPAGEESE